MKIELDPSCLKESHWYEYALRFLFGGAITVATGWIAIRFGPGVAGLFLAFPAIFPASATLIEKHERRKKEERGLNGARRGRQVAGIDAAGASMGSIGLMGFAIVVWRLLPHHAEALVLGAATAVWLGISIWVWVLRKAFW